MDIIIIDSGIKLSHPCFSNQRIESYELVDNKLVEVQHDNDEYGHGTAISYLITKSLERHGVMGGVKMIKAFSDEHTSEEMLVNAMEAACDRWDEGILNLSLGSLDGKATKLVEVCKKLARKMIILSANHNLGALTIPSILPEVIGVTADDEITNQDDYIWMDGGVLQAAACGKYQRVAWIGPDYCVSRGNSFACANMTGMIAMLIAQYGDGWKKEIGSHAKRVIHYDQRSRYGLKIPFEIKKAAIFPFSKETGSLVLFSDMLDFEIKAVYDLPISGKVGNETSKVLGMPVPKDFVIENIRNYCKDEDIDTFIIGHLAEYAKYPKERAKVEEFFQKCGPDVQFYFFDAVENSDKIFSPVITGEMVPPDHYGMLYDRNTPLLGVFGTSSKQGKFTLQLRLRKEFQKLGYKIGQLGTEPESLLFGFDAVFPMGYGSAVEIQGHDSIKYLNQVIHEMEIEEDKDLIIAGCQSGTVPYAFYSMKTMTLRQTEFLYGTCPDAVVLCINWYDENEYIERNIKFIEGSVGTKVLALVAFPKSLRNKKAGELTEEDKKKHIEELDKIFGIPVFTLGENMDMLCGLIVDYLSE